MVPPAQKYDWTCRTTQFNADEGIPGGSRVTFPTARAALASRSARRARPRCGGDSRAPPGHRAPRRPQPPCCFPELPAAPRRPRRFEAAPAPAQPHRGLWAGEGASRPQREPCRPGRSCLPPAREEAAGEKRPNGVNPVLKITWGAGGADL